jgi:DNA topoisomerase-3
MQLIVAEKSSQGKDIAKALGIPFLSTGAKLPGGGAAVVALAGHVLELADPEDYDAGYKRWSLSTLPILPSPFKREPSRKDVYKHVAELLKDPQVTGIVNGCDPDREGSLIFREVIERAGVAKKPQQRLWIKDLTVKGIKEAYAHLRPGEKDRPIQEAAKCRQEADWLVGINGTRAQSKLAESKGKDGTWSIGRCQTPTLAMVVDREKEIQAFKPTPFWTLKVPFETSAGTYVGAWFRPAKDGQERQDRFLKQVEADAVAAAVRGQTGRVASVEQKDEPKESEPFYDIGAIRAAAGKRFGFTGDKTNEILQSLYLKGVMSYPRTDFRHLTEAEAAKLPGILKAMVAWPEFAPFVQDMERLKLLDKKLGKRYVDDAKVGEHSALHPTGERSSKGDLTEDEVKVFSLVVRRVLAAFYPPMVLAKTTILTEVAGEQFATRGSVVKEEGWSKVDPLRRAAAKGKPKPQEDEEEEEEGGEGSSLPPVTQGMPAKVCSTDVSQGMTQPPKRYTEPDLENLMKTAGRFVSDEELQDILSECGIGTGATRADIIKTLLDRKYLERKKKILLPTPKAFELLDDIPDPRLKSPVLTAEWEQRLLKIEKASGDTREAFMADIVRFVTDLVDAYRKRVSPDKLKADAEAAQAADEPLAMCPKCGKGQLMRRKRRSDSKYFAVCSRKSCGVFAGVDDQGNLVLRQEPCVHCGAQAVTSSMYGDKCIVCDKNQGVQVSVKCDKCGSAMIGLTFNGKPYVKCLDQNKQSCKRSWNTTDETYATRAEAKTSLRCVVCGSPMVPKFHRETGPYVSCSNSECKCWWPTDGDYTKAKAICKVNGCGGPMRPTREQGPVCVKCGTFAQKKKD